MAAIGMEEAERKRWESLFACLDVAPFGSLFRVDESVWVKGLKDDYAARSTRRDHPGCSIRKNAATLGPIPLLHGTSRSYKRETVAVKDVYGKPHTTYFGGLDPVPTERECWLQKKVRMAEKIRLNSAEEKAMRAMCLRRGW